jgi:hypothetical protein
LSWLRIGSNQVTPPVDTQTTPLGMANAAPLAFTGNTVAEVGDDVGELGVDGTFVSKAVQQLRGTRAGR